MILIITLYKIQIQVVTRVVTVDILFFLDIKNCFSTLFINVFYSSKLIKVHITRLYKIV